MNLGLLNCFVSSFPVCFWFIEDNWTPNIMYILSSSAVACLSLLPVVSAFYPYTPVYSEIHSRKDFHRSVRRAEGTPNTRDGSVSLSIRRTPTRRANNYNIIRSQPPTQSNSAAIDQDGTDFSYMVTVTFGSSSEEYHMLLDSAASNTWVMGGDCVSDVCNAHNTFGNGDSTSLTISDKTFSVVYGTGQVGGNLANDTAHIAGFNVPLTFGLASNVSSDFLSYPMDGILGLGRGDATSNTIEAPSIMDILVSKSLIKTKLFGVHLSRNSSGVNDGELDFGTPNSQLYDGDLTYIPTIANTNGFWEVAVDDAGVDGETLGVKGRSAIIDTGTSFVLMPSDDAIALHKLISGSAQSGETFTVPCLATEIVQLSFGGVTFNISTADYVGRNLGGGACASNIIGRQTFGSTQWLVGDVYLKNVYTVFDFDGSRVGFGVKGEEKVASATTVSGSLLIPSKTSSPAGTTAPTAVSQQSLSASASPTHNMAVRGGEGSGVVLALTALIVLAPFLIRIEGLRFICL